MNDMLTGAIAGCLATAPMSVAMQAMFERLPWYERAPLPPRTITMRVARSVGAKRHLSEPARQGTTLLSHFAMGTGMGALFGGARRWIPLPAPLAGLAFGTAVWAANYAGLLPQSGLYAPIQRQTGRRVALMIAAHLVWGAAADSIAGLLSKGKGGGNTAVRQGNTQAR